VLRKHETDVNAAFSIASPLTYRRTVHGPESYTVARDSFRFSCSAYLACKGEVARTGMLVAFVALCLKWHVSMSVPTFMELAMRSQVGFTSHEEATVALKELVEASDRSTNWAADHTLDAYCAHTAQKVPAPTRS
jgi:hypothetical protein